MPTFLICGANTPPHIKGAEPAAKRRLGLNAIAIAVFQFGPPYNA